MLSKWQCIELDLIPNPINSHPQQLYDPPVVGGAVELSQLNTGGGKRRPQRGGKKKTSAVTFPSSKEELFNDPFCFS